MSGIVNFIRESNLIEAIDRDPTQQEIDGTAAFLAHGDVTLERVCALQEVYAPGKPLRDRVGMNVRVGHYTAPMGGRDIVIELMKLCKRVSRAPSYGYDDPWNEHCHFETLHPFMDGNGRTGRAIWAWHMMRCAQDPFALPFLHRWYYQTLEHSR